MTLQTGVIDAEINDMWAVVHDSGEFTSAVTNYDITGLEGDTDIEYRLIVRGIAEGGNLSLYVQYGTPTIDTGTTCGQQYMIGTNTSAAAGRFTSAGINITYDTVANTNITFVDCHIFAKSGKERTLLLKTVDDINGTTVTNVGAGAGSWSNTADEITALRVHNVHGAYFGTGSRVILLKKVHNTDMQTGDLTPNQITGAWERIYSNTLSSTASSVTISSLTGNTDCVYQLIFRPIDYNTVGNYYLRFNADSGSNYGWQYLYGSGTSVVAARGSGTQFSINATAVTGRTGLTDILIYAKSGYERTCLMEMNRDIRGSGETSTGQVSEMWLEGQSWNNTSNELTSMVISTQNDQMNIGTNIELYRLNL